MGTYLRPTLAGSLVERGTHACAFFHSADEEYQLLLPFSKQGCEHGDHLFQIVDARHRDERIRRLRETGIDVDSAARSQQLEVRTWEQAHLRNGKFDQHAMLSLVDEVLGFGERRFGGTRFWANMEWSLEDFPGVESLVEYESRLNEVTRRHGGIVICSYDLNRFSAAVVIEVLRTHPLLIIAGILQENPYYVPPEQYLRELRDGAAR